MSGLNLGLIGFPLEHSLSPVLHHTSMEALGLAGEYRLYPITFDAGWEEDIHALLRQMRVESLAGLNVTIPYKQNVIPLLDELTPIARQVGAVNCIYLQQGRLVGDNTDAAGFFHDLCQELKYGEDWMPGSPPSEALVLGAGGAARAVVYALISHGWGVTVAARRMEQGVKLVSEFQSLRSEDYRLAEDGLKSTTTGQLNFSTRLSALSWEHLMSQMKNVSFRLVVNATPVGMWPEVERSPWPPGLPWPGQADAYDLVYNPPITTLVRMVRSVGLRAVNGAGMLVEQAALAFERWTGMLAARREMRQALDRYLAEKSKA